MQYVAIIKQFTIFAEYSDYSESFNDLIIKVYIANRQNIEFYVIPYLNQYEIYFLAYKEYVFTTICTYNMNHEQILLYLQQLKSDFLSLLNNEKDQLTLKSTNLIRNTVEKFIRSTALTKIKQIEKELEETTKEKKNILNDMIDKELKLDLALENSNKLLSSVRFNFIKIEQ